MNREQWLGQLVEALRPTFINIGYPLPDRIRVACGWPSRSALSRKTRRIGEAWSQACSADGAHETFLSPTLSDPVEVGAVLVHELVHHAVGVGHGHKGPFTRCARSIGLEGKMRSTVAGPRLNEQLRHLTTMLGPYPHGALANTAGGIITSSGPTKQATRMLKVSCACGCIVRMARQWLDNVGVPTCGCGKKMQHDAGM